MSDLYEVHEDVSEALHVVPPALLDAQVGVDGGVPGRARQVLVFSAREEQVRILDGLTRVWLPSI